MKNKFYVHILRTHDGVMTIGGDAALQTNITRKMGDIYGFSELKKARNFVAQVTREGGQAMLQKGDKNA